jgi:hypothetical protein
MIGRIQTTPSQDGTWESIILIGAQGTIKQTGFTTAIEARRYAINLAHLLGLCLVPWSATLKSERR